MRFKEVTADDWSSEFSLPYTLANVDLWTQPSLGIIVRLRRATFDKNPLIKDLRALVNFPAWEGAAAQAVRDVVKAVQTTYPILYVDTVTTEPTQSWKIGIPHTERNYELTSIEQVLVNGQHRSASLSNGIVSISGPPAPTGADVRIAVRYKPNISIRRVGEVRITHKTPAWWIQDLVVHGGLNGFTTPMSIAGIDVFEKRSELRITINGIADRSADALAMRQALQEEFSRGLNITFPSGRCVVGQLLGLVEVVAQGQSNLPMATAIMSVPFVEYSATQVFKNRRSGDQVVDGVLIPGQPILTELAIILTDGNTTVDILVNNDSI
jgi:hypothetical protein